MISTALALAALFLLAIAPGFVLCGTARRSIGSLAAIATASLVVAMLATALLGVAADALFGHSLPAITLLPASLALLAGAILVKGRPRLGRPDIEWQAIAAAALFAGYGVFAYWMALDRTADGSLLIHAWYNADWFKHVSHVNGLANFGVPARDIFNGAGPLHYYWLSYVLPGAATAIGGDAWTAIYLANLAYVSLLALSFYGLVRAGGAPASIAAFLVILATIVTGRIEIWISLLIPNGIQILLANPIAPPEPALVSLALYIPQHALALGLLLGWATIALLPDTEDRRARRLVLIALAAVMTVSTLFGAMLLGIYGIVELARRRLAAVPELGAMAIASVLLVVLLGVFKLSDPTSAVGSKVDAGSIAAHPAMLAVAYGWLKTLATALGLTLLAGLYALFKLRPATPLQGRLRIFCGAMIVLPFLFLALVGALFGNGIAYEVYLRGLNPPAIAFGILGGWALSEALAGGVRQRNLVFGACAALVLIGLPAATIRELWHGQLSDSFTTTVPADDLAVLATLKAKTPRDTMVWQYPEDAFLAEEPGRDLWGPIFGGRALLASGRATDMAATAPLIALQKRYFAGEDVPIPARAGAVYLSRTLHPESYDALVARLKGNPTWLARDCRVSACLFLRRDMPQL